MSRLFSFYANTCIIFFLSIIIGELNVFGQVNGTVDTIYYDSDWVPAPMQEFATYKRIIFTSNDTTKYKNMYRDFYTSNNELQGEGGFKSLNVSEPSKSIYDGKCTSYYKNGNKKESSYYKNGLLNGEYTSFLEDGYLNKQCYYKNGKLDGILNIFDKKNKLCTQIKYNEGIPALEYYTISNEEGLCSRYRIDNDKIYYEIPSSSEMEYDDDSHFFYINKNGVMVAVRVGTWQYYGTYEQLRLNISNYTLENISFDPNKIEIEYIKLNKQGSSNRIKGAGTDDDIYHDPRNNVKRQGAQGSGSQIRHPYTAEEYANKITKRQNMLMSLYAITSSMSNVMAGYSTINSTSTTNITANSSYNGNVQAYGSSGSGYAYFGGRSNLNGTITTSTSTRVYDPYVAYQARVITQNNLQDFRYTFNKQLEDVYEGYMYKTQIPPAQTACGQVNSEYVKRFDIMRVTIYINDTPYTFEWNKADYE